MVSTKYVPKGFTSRFKVDGPLKSQMPGQRTFSVNSEKYLSRLMIDQYSSESPELPLLLFHPLEAGRAHVPYGSKDIYDYKTDKTPKYNNGNQPIFSLNIPYLPKPSDALKELLLKFNTMNVTMYLENNTYRKRPPHRLSKVKKLKLKRINGFIAFRSFYCRLISSPEHQRQLSVSLGKLWLDEPNKGTWNRYALEYNAYLVQAPPSTKPFVEWLCECLNLSGCDAQDSKTSVVNSTSWNCFSACFDNKVEDVYFVW